MTAEQELQWRRQWKPDLHACAWNPLSLAGEKHYFIKSKFDSVSYEILVTDLTRFWYEKLSEDKLSNRITELNPCFEAPLTKILDHIKNNISKQDKETQLALANIDNKFVLEMNSHIAGMPFSYSFQAELTNPEMGRDHLTVPLMIMVGELYRQQQELFKLLEAKDNQINDYKSQGAKVSRKNLETTPFDLEVFHSNTMTSKGFEEEVKKFGEKTFTSSVQTLYRAIVTKQAWLLSSPVKNSVAQESLNERTSGPSIESWSNRIPASVVPKDILNQISPKKSPSDSPSSSNNSSSESSPAKTLELIRRQELERKLELEAAKEQEKGKKKRKLKF